jgi:MFS transporter, PPP family, 3-phenylpropionic acid transporter
LRFRSDNEATAPNPLGRFLLLYAMLYGAFGVASPFLPTLIESRGLTVDQIGLVFAAGTAIKLLSAPLAGQLADGWGARREVLSVCALLAGTAALVYLTAFDWKAILAIHLLQAVALAPLPPLSDALALMASNPERGGPPRFEYGWVRGTGSAAFIAGSLVVGWMIPFTALSIILWCQAALLIGIPLAARRVPEPGIVMNNEPVTKEGLIALFRLPVFRRVVLVAALILGSHAMHDTFAVIRWSAAGISPFTISLLWSVSVAAEVAVFFAIGPSLLRLLDPAGAIALAACAGAVRWGMAAMTTDVAAVVVLQLLHGLTFALLHLACMRLLAENVPQQLAATAQAIYGTVGIGISTAVLTLVSGWLYARFGPEAFGMMSLLCLAALPLTAALRRR